MFTRVRHPLALLAGNASKGRTGVPGRNAKTAGHSRRVAMAIAAVACMALPMWTEAQGTGHDPAKQPPGARDASNVNDLPAVTPVRPEDLLTGKAEDYTIGRNDLVRVSIMDLARSGVESERTARVSETGTLSLPLLANSIRAEGLTEEALQRAIAAEYAKQGIIQNATVWVTVVEPRQRMFSVMGDAAGQPGAYALIGADFRLLDALATSKTGGDNARSIRVIRRGAETPGKPPEQPRIIAVPAKSLLAGDLRYNLVIRPRDLVVVTTAEAPWTPPNAPKKAAPAKAAPAPDHPATTPAWWQNDAVLQKLELDLLNARHELRRTSSKLGEQHPDVQRWRAETQALEEEVGKRLDELRRRAEMLPSGRDAGGATTPPARP